MSTLMMQKTEQLTAESATSNSSPATENFVGETPGTDKKTTFTAVDMWNRNRQSRSASMFLRKWDLN